MAQLFDARRAEIDGDGIKCGLRAAQHHRRRAPDGAVGAVGGDEFAAKGEAAAAAEGPQQHQCRRLTGDAHRLQDRPQPLCEEIQSAAGAEHGDGGQQRQEMGKDPQQDSQSLCRPVGEGLIDVDLFPQRP